MESEYWDPTCGRPGDLVAPVRVDPLGITGPTRRRAQGPSFRRTGPGLYVPSDVDATVPEQRILEQAHRLTSWGAATGWAALRWRGARYFDGLALASGVPMPVPLLVALAKIRPDGHACVIQEQLAPAEREQVAGIWVTSAHRALFDAVRSTRALREGVVMVEMAAAAGLMDVRGFADYVTSRQAWTGVPFARRVVRLSIDDSRSPQETRMRLCWLLDAQLPAPLCNRALYDLSGRLLGVPDLFDPVAGLVGEYDGAHHKHAERHRKDVGRADRFRDHGLEYFEVVGGELGDRRAVAGRMIRTRRRALFLAPDQRRWSLSRPRDVA